MAITKQTVVDHDIKLGTVLKRCRKRQLCLSKDKLRVKDAIGSIHMSHVLTDKGITSHPKKLEAIHKMPKPTDVAKLDA